ncbi:hypothetical protein T4B_6437 [Trichinella pseudospiralis]|uniref:Uncharacterized protein n=1 Tax=Trichinella pseudospiralis TaxID=6337 RepID=A0A0V1IAZ3_TRIPS|nr:hypothetical protein T4B_6437 [Trichinella pseudospiralis]
MNIAHKKEKKIDKFVSINNFSLINVVHLAFREGSVKTESQKSTLRSLAKNMTSFLPSRFQSFKDKKKGAQPTSTAAESPRSDSSGDRDSTS